MTRTYTACRHAICRFCLLDIEGFAPYRKGEWMDRGRCYSCPDGKRKHAPVLSYRS